jgi:hypothetical protein
VVSATWTAPALPLTIGCDSGSVRHPNYDDILAALLAGGLDDIEERVPISVGGSSNQSRGYPVYGG